MVPVSDVSEFVESEKSALLERLGRRDFAIEDEEDTHTAAIVSQQ